MATAHIGAYTRRRPATVLATIGVLGFLGVSALGGGTVLVPNGETAPPKEWLADIPVVDSWLVPGLVLGVGFGLGSLVVAFGMLRKPRWRRLGGIERLTGLHWSWLATVLIGAGQIVWIGLELIYLPELSPLQAVYGGVGVALVVLALLRPVRDDLRTDRPDSGREDGNAACSPPRQPRSTARWRRLARGSRPRLRGCHCRAGRRR